MSPEPRRLIPLWIKIAWTAFVLILIPVWIEHHGAINFLWFSDIALFALTIALWLESRLIASMMAVAVLIPEVAWNVDYLLGLAIGEAKLGIADHMFNESKPMWVRAMSLFHIPLLIALVWLPWRLGYDGRALPAQIVLAWIVLPTTWLLTQPDRNINWVHGFGGQAPQQLMPPLVYLGLLMLAYPLLLYVPTHFLLRRVFRPEGGLRARR
jgi:hypothetical protein